MNAQRPKPETISQQNAAAEAAAAPYIAELPIVADQVDVEPVTADVSPTEPIIEPVEERVSARENEVGRLPERRPVYLPIGSRTTTKAPRQLKILKPAPEAPEWKLDEETKAVGRQGLDGVRAALQQARREALERDRQSK